MILDICRVCENKNQLLRIFENGNDEIARKLIDFANVEIEESDDLPQFICLQCFKELENAHSFKVKCQKTDRKFRNAIELQKTDLENFIDIEEQFTNRVAQNNDNDFEIKHEKLYDKEFMSDGEKSNYSEESINEQTDNYMNEEYILEEPNCNDNEIVINDSKDFIEDIRVIEEGDIIEYVGNEEELPEETKRPLKNKSAKIHKCNTCKEEFLKFSDLNIHKKSHGNERYQCEICSKWFSKSYRLRNHMDTHKNLIFSCNLCKNQYTNKGNLDRHIRHFHKQERRFTCNVCGLKFYRSTVLLQHLATHTNERNFVCECGKSFKTSVYLETHKKSHIPIEIRRMQNKPKRPLKIYTCPHCNKISNSSVVHKNHLRRHTEEKPYECSICKKSFKFHQSLRTHIRLHTGEKPFKCKSCGVSFRQIGHLKGHELIHSGIKNHKCEFCDKSFTLKGNLTVHLRLHTGETPYHCDKCDKKFYDSNGLKRHKISHTKDNTIKEINPIQELSNLDSINVYLYDQENEYAEIIELPAINEVELKTEEML